MIVRETSIFKDSDFPEGEEQDLLTFAYVVRYRSADECIESFLPQSS